MSGIYKSLCIAVMVCFVGCASVWAQATAQISGRVTDQTEAVLPGVEITATQTATGITRSIITNETGSFVLPNLALGPYRLEASLPGFRTYARTGIVLQVNSSPTINVILEVGQVAETVEVQANAALVETRDVGVSAVLDNTRVLELPLDGRSAVELIELAGGTAPAATVGGMRNPWASNTGVSVAGGSNRGIYYTLDGGNHIQPQDGSHGPLPFPDAMQEFKADTSATSARSGFKAGGSVHVVTKSGTNEFHGNLFEFVRNGKFNARNAFAAERDSIKRNQFGGTIGGAIIRNKLFFFAGYQATKIREAPSQEIAFVPTAAMLAGDFTAFASPACNRGRPITLRAPFVNNRIDPALFSRAAVTISSKLPQAVDSCGTTIYGFPNLENGYQAVGRIDYQQSANHSWFGRYLIDGLKSPAPYDISKNLLTANGNRRRDALAQAFTLGSTYLFSANVVNALRLTANRTAAGRVPPDTLEDAGIGPADLGLKTFSPTPRMPDYAVTGAFDIGEDYGPTRTAVFAIDDNVNVLSGNHEMGFGTALALWHVSSYTTVYNSNWTFNGARTGLGLADFLTGFASDFQNGNPVTHSKRSYMVGVYGTDTWKVNPKLNLTYGLRWEPYFPIRHRDGTAVHFDEEAFRRGIRSGRFDRTPPGVFFDGDPGFPGLAGAYDKWWNFSPRVGLAWDIQGDGRTSVRASAGTFYDFPNSHYLVSFSAGAPFVPRIAVSDVPFENPWANYPGGDPFPTPAGRNVPRDAAFPPYSLVTAMDYDTPNVQSGQWNLSLQRQIGTDWMASASYLGSSTWHLWSIRQLNPGVYIPGIGNANGNCTYNGRIAPFRVRPGAACSVPGNNNERRRLFLENPETGILYGDIPQMSATGIGSYNGLVLSVERRAAAGVSVNANYTWSHCINEPATGSGGTAFGTRGNVGWTNDNRRLDRGDCNGGAEDRRHVFNLSGVAETPQFSNPALRAIVANWRLSPILKIGAGSPLNVITTRDITLQGLSPLRVDQVLPNVYGDKTPGNYLNAQAFAFPKTGTFGNLGSGSVRGPGYWQFNVALTRSFRFGEAQRLELRAEAFNLTNSVILNAPQTRFESGNFGKITSAQDPRIMQFALKYFF
jgi:hypothetical protein